MSIIIYKKIENKFRVGLFDVKKIIIVDIFLQKYKIRWNYEERAIHIKLLSGYDIYLSSFFALLKERTANILYTAPEQSLFFTSFPFLLCWRLHNMKVDSFALFVVVGIGLQLGFYVGKILFDTCQLIAYFILQKIYKMFR